MRLVYATAAGALPPRIPNRIPVMLYGLEAAPPGAGCVGARVFRAVKQLDRPVSSAAFDFLTLALAATAAETFVARSEAADGWTRQLDLFVPLRHPALWAPIKDRLAETLRFLTGDVWSLDLREGGPAPPSPGRARERVRIAGHDRVCLLSGGLDSAIGAIDLTASGRRPLLVSHTYRDDGPKQEKIHRHLANSPSRFAAVAYPSRGASGQLDNTMRGRSLNFLAFAVVAASAVRNSGHDGDVEIVVPENGFIALNPPPTLRRLGSLSTRTTHPHFLRSIEAILRDVGLPVRLVNPYWNMTKGEMIKACADQDLLRTLAMETVSCGKWKRTRMQCGRCVPCLIRRASFHAAGWTPDPTRYSDLGFDLRSLLARGKAEQRGDLVAMLRAVAMAETPELERRVWLTGPLPLVARERQPYVDVARRGLRELGSFLALELGG